MKYKFLKEDNMFQGNGKMKVLIDYIVSFFIYLFDATLSGNYQHMQKLHNTRN